MSASTGETARSIAAADRLTYDDWKANEIRRYEATGATAWFSASATARSSRRGTRAPADAYTGPLWAARPWLTGEALEWFDVLGEPRYTFADWQDLRRAERKAVADELQAQADGHALASLAYWRELHARRGEFIAMARVAGTPWGEIQAASGLSRAQCHELARAFHYAPDVPGVRNDADDEARRFGYADAAAMHAAETPF